MSTSDARLPRWQRSLLPAMLGADHADRGQAGPSRLPRTLRDWAVDIALFLIACAFGVAGWWSDHESAGTVLLVVDVALGAGACLSLWVRRRAPLPVAVATIAASAVSGAAGGAALVALFSATLYCRTRVVGALLAGAIVSDLLDAVIIPGRHSSFNAHGVYLGIFAELAVIAFGAFVRARRELVLSLHERNRRLQDEQVLRVQEARLAERNRIAREMHDVLAHRISLLSVHAGALEFHPDAPAEEVASAAQVIRENARAAQEELREVLGVLRADGPADALEPPQPTLADLRRLVEESRAAGMDVELRTALSQSTLAPALGRTAFRVVQEALTNVRKHAAAEAVTIELGGREGASLRIEVVNRPRVGAAVAVAGRGHPRGPDPIGSGTGLIGLRERVALAGGTLTHGTLPGGGYRIEAALPWPAP